MAISKHDQQELDDLRTDWKEQFPGRREDFFPIQYLTHKFGLSVPDAASRVAWGNNDYGLDAFYIDRITKNLYLYQFKWTEDHRQFQKSLDRLYAYGMDRIFSNDFTPNGNENLLLRALRDELYVNRDLVRRVLIEFVFKGDLDAVERSEGLKEAKERLEGKCVLVHEFFPKPDVQLSVQFVTHRSGPGGSGTRTIAPKEIHQIHFEGTGEISDPNGHRMLIGFVPLMDLVRINSELSERFFDRNIRSTLDPNNPPNRKIRDALRSIVLEKDEEKRVHPSVFTFNHNGITLACEKFDLETPNNAVVHVPRLLNGAQTVSSAQLFLDEEAKKLVSPPEQQILDSIRVVAKIVVADPASKFVTQVTISNNQQNPVEPWHLRANDSIQCRLHDKFREEAGIYYSRQENAFKKITDKLSEKELQAMRYRDTSRDVRMRELAQTFLATQGDLPRMSHLRGVFENETAYESTFKESYLHCDVRKILLAYKVQFCLSDATKELEPKLPQYMQPAIRRLRNLLWALLIQSMFNDPTLPETIENYAVIVRAKLDFKNYIRELTRKYVVKLLHEFLSTPENKAQLENGKLDFLRTKKAFDACKQSASARWDWSRRSF